jgi:hypothetical protein
LAKAFEETVRWLRQLMDYIILKTKYEERQEIRRFKIDIKNFTYATLNDVIGNIYNEAKEFNIKVQQNEDYFSFLTL